MRVTSLTFLSCFGAVVFGAAVALGAPGDELWSHQYNAASGYDFPQGLAVKGRRVFLTGKVVGGGGDDDLLVRALDAKTGALLWSDEFDLAGGNDSGMAVAAGGRSIFVVGHGANGLGNDDLLVRAYDARDGALLWSQQIDTAGSDERAVAVNVKGRMVFVAARTENAAADYDFLVRAYDGKQGNLLWGDQFDLEADDDEPRAMAVRGSRLFVAGVGETAAGGDDLLVRAYSARDGSLLWQDHHDVAGESDQIGAIAVWGNSVFLGATVVPGPATGSDIAVRTLDAKTGALRWEHQWTSAGSGDGTSAVVVKGKRVFAVGTNSPPGNAFFTVRALDTRDGTILWDDQFDAEGMYDAASAAAISGSSLYVVGVTESAATGRDHLLRTYDAKTGALLWDDQFDLAGGSDQAWEVAVKGKRLFILGSGVNANPDGDILLRALEAR